MAAVFVSMIVTAGAGFGAATALARYAQRNWARQPVAVEA